MPKEDRDPLEALKSWRTADDDAEEQGDDGDVWNIKKLARARMSMNGALPDGPGEMKPARGIRGTGEIQTGGGFSRKTTDAGSLKRSDISMAFVEKEVQNPKSRELIVTLETVAKRCCKEALHERLFLDAFQAEKAKAGAFFPVYMQDFVLFLSGKTVCFQNEEWTVEITDPSASAKNFEEGDVPHLTVCHKHNGRKALLTLMEIMGGLRYY